MRLHIDQIPDEGWVVEFDATAPWALAAATTALDVPPTALSGRLVIRNFAKQLAVSGKIQAVAPQDCHRCGEGVRLTVGGPVALTYTPTPDAGEAPAPRQLAPGELDVGFYDGEFLDLAAVVSEQLVLLLPSKLACDIPGIEPIDECAEERVRPPKNEPKVDPRFAVLADLKIEG
jgi:uncharacterized metal-binding protein YceD (DUF177 family)